MLVDFEYEVLAANNYYTTTLIFKEKASFKITEILPISFKRKVSKIHIVVDQGFIKKNVEYFKYIASISYANILVLKGGEKVKSIAYLQKLISWFDNSEVGRRNEPIIVIGGGALIDLTSFAASIYKRGVPIIRIPTTLLGMVDAGISAKTAINFQNRKNIIGTFHPPTAIIIDVFLLSTLSKRMINSGIAEMIKLAISCDYDLWESLEKDLFNLQSKRFNQAESSIKKATKLMANAIWPDLWESNLNRPTDLGHSISKIIEEKIKPQPTHGEAVILDIAITIGTSAMLNIISLKEFQRIIGFIIKVGFKVDHEDINADLISKGCRDTFVHRDGSNLWPMPVSIGKVKYVEISSSCLLKGQKFLREYLKSF